MSSKVEEQDVVEIDLSKLIRFYLKYWWVLCLSVVVLAGATLFVTHEFITPKYQSNVTVYVNNVRSVQSTEEISDSSLTASQKLVNTYINIIKSDTVLWEVIKQGDLKCVPEDIREIMTTQQLEDTELFTVSISHENPDRAAHIANTIAKVAPGKISEFVEGSSAKIIDYAKVEHQPYSPSYPKNTVLGGLAGLILAGLVLTVRYLLDMKLRNEEDLNRFFDLPVLGVVPDFEQLRDETKNNRKKRRGRYDDEI